MIHAIRHRVDQMLNAVMASALVYPNIMAIHIQDADRNVFWTQIVRGIKRAFEANV